MITILTLLTAFMLASMSTLPVADVARPAAKPNIVFILTQGTRDSTDRIMLGKLETLSVRQ